MSEPPFQALVQRLCQEHERILAVNDELSKEVARLRTSRDDSPWVFPGISRDNSAIDVPRKRSKVLLPEFGTRSFYESDARSFYGSTGCNSPAKERASSDAERQSALVPNRRAPSVPLHLQLWPTWSSNDHIKVLSMTKSHITNKTRSKSRTFLDDEATQYRAGDVVRQRNSLLQKFVMMPNSLPHGLWDVASALCLCYDIVVIPLHACTPFPENDFMVVMGWLMAIFWTLDIPVSFLTGYRTGSLIEMRPHMVAKHYIRTWFIIDVPLVIGNWAFLLLGTTSRAIVGSARLSKFARLVRVVRTIRLLRLGKVLTSLTEFAFMLWTQDLLAVLGIFKMLLGIVVLNHYIACVWYGLGDSDGFGNDTWLRTFSLKYGDPDFGFAYTTALHWSITQFTPASMEVVPTNTLERVFAVAVIIFALVVFSSALASITGTITRLREFHTEQNRRLDSMLQFFHANKLSSELGSRIYRFVARYQKKKAARILEKEVTAFQVLPNSMLMEMHFEVFAPILLKHPFLSFCENTAHDLIFNLCHHAASENHLRSGEEVFVAGNRATKMYFIVGGSLEYQQHNATGQVESLPVCSGICCCEQVLWVQWTHQGRLSAESVSDLVALHPELFCSLVASHDVVYQVGRECARLCQENLLYLTNANKQLSDLLSDWEGLADTVNQAMENVQKELRNHSDISAMDWREWNSGPVQEPTGEGGESDELQVSAI